MNKIVEFFKRLFRKKPLALNEVKDSIEIPYLNSKESFFDSIKIDNSLLLLQQKLENGVIDENDLTIEQVAALNDLYCEQISNLIRSINNYKFKLNI